MPVLAARQTSRCPSLSRQQLSPLSHARWISSKRHWQWQLCKQATGVVAAAGSSKGFQGSSEINAAEVAASLLPPSQGQVAVSDHSSNPVTQLQLPGQLATGTVVGGKYTVTEVLGQGSNATTYKVRDPEGQELALKALSLRGLRDWKQLELFQREAKILSSLQHPGIPKYVDYFEDDSPADKAFYLVQEVAQGQTLAELVKSGRRASEPQVRRIALELLSILEYLGSLSPPVIHRDIKPENIVLQGGSWDGRVFLVDFGGVQGVASSLEAAIGGSTIVGTFGYMAPEQFRGSAQPASDLYALGATLLFLFTGQPPSSWPQERMRINWRALLAPAPPAPWPRVLDGFLEPLAEDRLGAREAAALLRGEEVTIRKRSGTAKQTVQPQPTLVPRNAAEAYAIMTQQVSQPVTIAPRKPAGTRVQLQRTSTRLDITIPPKGLNLDTMATGSFAIVWNAFVAMWTVGVLASGAIIMALFSVPFWFAGAQLAQTAFSGALLRERLAIGPNKWRLGKQLALIGKDGQADFLDENSKVTEGLTSDMTGARIVTLAIVNSSPQTAIEVVEGVNKFKFGEGLDITEQEWLVGEINEWLGDFKGMSIDFDSMPRPDFPRIYNDTEDDFTNRRN